MSLLDNPNINKRKKEKISIAERFKGVKQEVSKVVWPTKQEIVAFTAIVFAACTFFTLLFWGFDTGFAAILKSILKITLK